VRARTWAGALVLGAAAAYLGWIRPRHLTWGATRQEAESRLPGDGEVPEPVLAATRAVTIDAPPAQVWPWLVQIGYRRAGWYAFDLFDNDGIPSAETILPEYQDLAVGEVIGEEGFTVTGLEENRTLLLAFHHPRTEWVVRRGVWPRFGDCSLCFHLVPVAAGERTRLLVRMRFGCPPRWMPLLAGFEPADFVQQRKMMAGIKRRAEGLGMDGVTSAGTETARPRGPGPGRRARVLVLAAAVLAVVGFTRYRAWHLRWGATDAEAGEPLPGDDLIRRAHFVPTRAVTIAAPPDAVWPWIVQIGMGRAGWYSYDLLDNLGRRSADRIVPELQDVAVGDWIPMSPRASRTSAFRVHEITPDTTMLWSKPDSTWVWVLRALPGNRTRLITRVRVRYQGWILPLAVPLMELGDFPMMRRCLLGIRDRAERAEHAGRAERDPTHSA